MSLRPILLQPHTSSTPGSSRTAWRVPAWQRQVSPLQGWDISSGHPRADPVGPPVPSGGRGNPRAGWGHETRYCPREAAQRSFCGNLWSRQLPKLAAVWEGRGGGHVCPLRWLWPVSWVKSWARIVGFFAGSKLWMLGCIMEPREPRATMRLCLHKNLQRDGCQLGGERLNHIKLLCRPTYPH